MGQDDPSSQLLCRSAPTYCSPIGSPGWRSGSHAKARNSPVRRRAPWTTIAGGRFERPAGRWPSGRKPVTRGQGAVKYLCALASSGFRHVPFNGGGPAIAGCVHSADHVGLLLAGTALYTARLDRHPQTIWRLLLISGYREHHLTELPRRIIGKRIFGDVSANAFDWSMRFQDRLPAALRLAQQNPPT
jgi:hypothetical protein